MTPHQHDEHAAAAAAAAAHAVNRGALTIDVWHNYECIFGRRMQPRLYVNAPPHTGCGQ